MSASTPTRIITDHLRYEDGFIDGYQARDDEFAAAAEAADPDTEVATGHAAKLDVLLDHARDIAPWPLPEPLTVEVALVSDAPPPLVPFDRERR